MACIRFLWFCWSCLERSRWQQRAALQPGEGSPLFRRGSRCARAFEQGRVPMFTRESKQEPSAREVKNRKTGLRCRSWIFKQLLCRYYATRDKALLRRKDNCVIMKQKMGEEVGHYEATGSFQTYSGRRSTGYFLCTPGRYGAF